MTKPTHKQAAAVNWTQLLFAAGCIGAALGRAALAGVTPGMLVAAFPAR